MLFIFAPVIKALLRTKIMKFKRIGFTLSILFLVNSFDASAQMSGLFQKVKDKAAQKASDMMDKKSTSNSDLNSNTKRAKVNSAFDFIPGDSILVSENFANMPIGTTPKTIKTNGAGSIVTVNDFEGKWLAFESSASYRLSKQYQYPKNFTVEFDLLASADKISDMSPVDFGFTNDNSVKEYLQASGAFTSLLYYNNNEIIVSGPNGKHLSTTFDLTPYVNRIMHISMIVDGQRMAVYLDKTKIADTELFLTTDTKNFYISAPLDYKNGAKLLFSGLKINGFKNR